MPLLTSARRALPAAILFIAIAHSQTCYLPDGNTIASNDTPCGGSNATAAACCPADSFCLDNGLCYGEGLVSRASCTDATWDSPACAGYCRTESPSSAIGITPCASDGDSNTFICGLNTTDCQAGRNTFVMSGGSGVQLRASQVATLLQSVLAASPSATAATGTSQVTVTATPAAAAAAASAGRYTATDMLILGCALGIPLFLALCAALFLLRRERQKHAKPKLMYKLPDSCKDDAIAAEFTFRPPPLPRSSSHVSHASPYLPSSVSEDASRRASFRTMGSSPQPGQIQSFLERYETMKQKGRVHEPKQQRHELDTGMAKELPRHELGDGRVSR
ncbi:hypothetical protein LTR53_004929 [Teratosphaeriaceae sp. CCFEE 6253]|nr:hypothetical protein LTR53_004929 [Teratosphaeriaceae sp. CCFEE 6253]